jgi:hypothetical protein
MNQNNQSQSSQDTVNSNKEIGLRKFVPMIIQTKEELITAMREGRIKSTKYNLLDDREKMFVELVCFGGYSGEQAVRAIVPGTKAPLAIANRIMSNPDVRETINELTVAKDRKFAAEIASAREMALDKLKFIMATTDDPALAASCAKTILDKAETYVKQNDKKEDEPVGGVRFNIKVDNVNVNGAPSPKKDEPVIIELTPDEINKAVGKEVVLEDGEVIDPNPKEVNPDTGLPYVLKYEGIDNYK